MRVSTTQSPRVTRSRSWVWGGNKGYGTIPNYKNQIQLPLPYASGSFTNQKTASGVLTYTFVASQRIINTLKYGYSRTWGQSFSPSDNTPFSAANSGILTCRRATRRTPLPVSRSREEQPARKDRRRASPQIWIAAPSRRTTTRSSIICCG